METKNCNVVEVTQTVFVERAHTDNDQLKMTVTEMEPIPIGGNPFIYDSVSMGTQVSSNWVMMYTTGLESSIRRPYLVNTKTGQRFNLGLESVVPVFHDVIYTDSDKFVVGKRYYFRKSSDSTYDWFEYDNNSVDVDPSLIYRFNDEHNLVREGSDVAKEE